MNKFRIWDKECDRYIDNYDIHDFFILSSGTLGRLFDYDFSIYTKENYPNEFERYVLEYCSTLKDKNGTEIYVGDIFEINNKLIGIVEWQEENARFIMSVHNGSIDKHDKDILYIENLYIYPFEMMEIKGSIHGKVTKGE